LDRKKALGHRVSGKPPYGYEFQDGRVVANQSEQQAIHVIRRLRGKGLSVRKIVGALEKKGLYNREGKSFSVSVIHKILHAA